MPFARLPPLPIRAQEMRASALATLLAFALIGPSLAHATAEAANIEIGDTLTGNYLAALVANEDHDASAAAAYFREALRADPRNQDILARSFAAALESGAFADASVLADRVLAHDPGNSLARLTGAARAISDGQFSAARLQLGQGDAGRARDITTTLIDAWAYAGAGDLRRALAVADRITDPKVQSFKNFHAGLIAETLGDSAEAQRRLKSAYEADKGTLRLVDAYGRFLSRHNDAEGAKAVYRDFAKIAGRQALVEAAQAELSAGRVLERLVHNAREGAAEVLYGLGAGGGSEGDEIAEIIYLRLALQLRPDHALAAVTLGDLLNQIKQGDAAIKAFGALPTDSPLRESADIQAALTLDTLSRPADALKRMREIVEAHPRDIEALTAYASLQRAGKDFAGAAITYSQALEIIGAPEKTYWSLYYFRGICYERSKRWPLAEADFKKALELFPEQPLVLNYLGYSWIDQGLNLDEAFKMLRRAVELKPNDGYIVDSLGWAHYKLGHYREALDQMEKAVALKPADPTINDHLGDVYWRVNRKNEAHFQWNHARDMSPDEDDLPAILKKIQDGLSDVAATSPAANQDEAAPAAPKKDGG